MNSLDCSLCIRIFFLPFQTHLVLITVFSISHRNAFELFKENPCNTLQRSLELTLTLLGRTSSVVMLHTISKSFSSNCDLRFKITELLSFVFRPLYPSALARIGKHVLL